MLCFFPQYRYNSEKSVIILYHPTKKCMISHFKLFGALFTLQNGARWRQLVGVLKDTAAVYGGWPGWVSVISQQGSAKMVSASPIHTAEFFIELDLSKCVFRAVSKHIVRSLMWSLIKVFVFWFLIISLEIMHS